MRSGSGWTCSALFLGLVVSIVPVQRIAAAPAAVPPVPPPPTSAFPPGIWKGVARASGGISGNGVEGFIVAPFLVRFEVEVAPDGTVVGGVWDWAASISSAAEGVAGNFELTASGELGGSGAAVTLSGVVHMAGTVSVQGNVIDVANDAPAAATFAPWSATCNAVWGDFATLGREAQAAAGLATTVSGPFSAHRIGNAGDAAGPGFEETFAELVTTGEALLAAGTPPAAEVVDFVQRAEDFYHAVFAYSNCPGDSSTVRRGTQAYTYFVVLIGSLLVAALQNPSAYDAFDLHLLALAAVRIGVVGAASPSPELSAQVKQLLANALASALLDAEETDNKVECAIVFAAATALGLTDLAGAAQTCAAG